MSEGWVSPSGGAGEGSGRPPQYGEYAPQGGPGPGQRPPYPPHAPQPGFRPMAPKPGVIPLRPLSLGDVFGGAFATIRGNPGATLGLSLAVHLLTAVPTVLITLWLKQVVFPDGITFTDDQGFGENDPIKIDLITPIAQIFSYLGTVVLAGMLVVVVADAVLGRRIGIGETWRRVRPRLWPLFGMTLLVLVATLAGLAVAVGIVALAAVTVGPWLAVPLGILLGAAAVVALVVVNVRLGLAAPALVLEQVGPIEALRRSWTLSRGAFWRLLGITLLASLLAGLVSGILGAPGSIANLIGYATTGAPSVILLIVGQLWVAVAAAMVAPFVTGTTGLLYIDQRMRTEGLDVTLMATAASLRDAPR